jgi:pimeloyl-ACP methyl ester carboxylesterase
MIGNAATFHEEAIEPAAFTVDLGALGAFRQPVLLTVGGQSPPFFARVVDRLMTALPRAQRKNWEEVGHVPHWSHPAAYADMIAGFILGGRV